jgi:hypothetical protein
MFPVALSAILSKLIHMPDGNLRRSFLSPGSSFVSNSLVDMFLNLDIVNGRQKHAKSTLVHHILDLYASS